MSDSIHDEDEATAGDSVVKTRELKDPNILKVYQTGELTVVGFGGQDVPDEVCIAAYREQLFKLVEESQCKVLAFDLTGVTLVPSGMLGVLMSLRNRVGRVELYNPSDDVREVLRMTRLETLFDIKQVDL
ncbi:MULTISPECIES: STAS domain-containing protein [unclassified Schlesneria]|uniref:STAS domain-containing protein n=1 Tax=Schlesneria TaxID=656899 RepID=UPI002EF972D9